MAGKTEAQSEYIHVARTSLHVWAPICMLGRCFISKISASDLSRKSIKSALLVGLGAQPSAASCPQIYHLARWTLRTDVRMRRKETQKKQEREREKWKGGIVPSCGATWTVKFNRGCGSAEREERDGGWKNNFQDHCQTLSAWCEHE